MNEISRKKLVLHDSKPVAKVPDVSIVNGDDSSQPKAASSIVNFGRPTRKSSRHSRAPDTFDPDIKMSVLWERGKASVEKSRARSTHFAEDLEEGFRRMYLKWLKVTTPMKNKLDPAVGFCPENDNYILITQDGVTNGIEKFNRPDEYSEWKLGTHYWWRVSDAKKF